MSEHKHDASLLCPTCDHASHDYCYIRHVSEAQTECGHYKPVDDCDAGKPAFLAPGLTEAQVEAVRDVLSYLDWHDEFGRARALRAAFPALFEGKEG